MPTEENEVKRGRVIKAMKRVSFGRDGERMQGRAHRGNHSKRELSPQRNSKEV